jgi:hypothetical protein
VLFLDDSIIMNPGGVTAPLLNFNTNTIFLQEGIRDETGEGICRGSQRETGERITDYSKDTLGEGAL